MNNTITPELYLGKRDSRGNLVNQYSPLQNLVDEAGNMTDFTTENLNFDMEHPVDILPLDAYDGAVNLIINDGKNPPRLINSRFSVQNDTEFLIPEHFGFKDTNIYDDTTFDIDTRLKAIYRTIPNLEYKGLVDSGNLHCGSYTFYFKLADADGNEGEVCQESGIVLVHIGHINDADSIRMGVLEENAQKSVKFTLTNIDSGFDYVHVLYAKTSSGNDLAAATTYHKVIFNYPVTNNRCDITITGDESIIGISKEEFYVDFADINAVKTLTASNNVLLFGNVNKTLHDYDALREMSWKIFPNVTSNSKDVKLGSLTSSTYKDDIYPDPSVDHRLNYYNTKNVYKYVGYWPDEIYRFGIVYIFEDNSLSPVFNIQGCDILKCLDLFDEYYLNFFDLALDGAFTARDYEPGNSEDDSNVTDREDYFFYDLNNFTNSRGVVKLPKGSNYTHKGGILTSEPIGIVFDFSKINYKQIDENGNPTAVVGSNPDDISAILKKHKIMGFFFVRLKRIPTILAQGMVIGLTDKARGALPVIKTKNKYLVQSFLDDNRTIRPKGIFKDLRNSTVKPWALLVPDAELSEATFNQLFVGNEYCLDKVASVGNRQFLYNRLVDITRVDPNSEEKKVKATLLNIPEETSVRTDGTHFFSTMAGNASEPYKTADVDLPWRWSLPQDLTESTTVVRGLWGPYVGLTTVDGEEMEDGDIVNIKMFQYYDNDEEAEYLDFVKRFNSGEQYHAITHRINIDDIIDIISNPKHLQIAYRGDCFTSIFTHRMYRNFIDPELPTNHTIIDPSCWAKNYGVRCTTEIILHTHSNLTADSEGWYIEDPRKDPGFDWQTMLVLLLTGNLLGALLTLKNAGMSDKKMKEIAGVDPSADEGPEEENVDTVAPKDYKYQEEDDDLKEQLPEWQRTYYPNGMANEIVQAFEVHLTKKGKYGRDLNKKVNPKELESQGGFNLKAIFKSDDSWELRGLSSINRADINAVALGQWISFPICSSKNISMRDVDYSNATEEASFHEKRSFYPLKKLDSYSPLRDSNIINLAAMVSVPDKGYIGLPNVPFIKQEYFTRVLNSLHDSADSVTNEFKLILENAYGDFTKLYGLITKLVAVPKGVLVVFSHGLGIFNLDFSGDATGYIKPESLVIISKEFGSIWKDSIISTDAYVYGVDSVAKLVWRIRSDGAFEIISAHKISKFLIDNLKISEFVRSPYIGHVNIKTHYNAFKHDIIFTYYNDTPLDSEGNKVQLIGLNVLAIEDYQMQKDFGEDLETPEERRNSIVEWKPLKAWSICYNEDTGMWTTFYDWEPIESANIDNIWFSFDRELSNAVYEGSDSSSLIPLILNNSKHIDSAIRDNNRRSVGSQLSKPISLKDKTDATSLGYINRSQIDSAFSDKIECFEYISGTGRLEIKEKIEGYDYYGYYYQLPNDEWRFKIKKLTTNDLSLESESCLITSAFPISTSTISGCGYSPEQLPEFLPQSELSINNYALRDFSKNSLKLYKHGFAGVYDNLGKIKPTNWYGKLHEFNFEFIVNKNAGILKIFNNLKMISNKAEPYKFEFEVVGEAYDWYEYKLVLNWIYNKFEDPDEGFRYVLSNNYSTLRNNSDFPILFNRDDDFVIKKLPYMKVKEADIPGLHYSERNEHGTGYTEGLNPTDSTLPHNRIKDDGVNQFRENSSVTMLVHDDLLNEYRIRTELLGNNVKKFGRVRGNMQYLEDLWNVEIRPVSFKWIYLKDGELTLSKSVETRLRDKYCKVKVRYSGEDLVIIQAILTMFDYSYA